jgi:hypothetical protein
MADGFFPTLISKDANPNSASNVIFANLSDGTNSLDITAAGAIVIDDGGSSISIDDNGGSITVDGTVAVSSVGGTVTVSATDLDIRDLAFATDKVDVSGSSVTVSATDLDIRNLVFATDKVDVTGSSVTVSGSVTVSATDLDIRDLTLAQDAVKVSANTTANGPANPIYVALGAGPITGEVHDYNTATVAGGATSNHDYTVTTALLLKAVEFSCSGGGKVELQVGPVASLVSKWVGFVPKAGGVVQLKLDPPIEVPVTSTGTVRLIRTNREGSSQDLYSTIIGIDA